MIHQINRNEWLVSFSISTRFRAKFKLIFVLRGESHIDFRTQCVIVTLVGGGVIANDVLIMRKVIEFQNSWIVRSSRSEVFLVKGVLKICSKSTGEHPCRSVISFIEIALRHGCPPANLLHIFRTTFTKNTSGWLPVNFHWLQNSFSCPTAAHLCRWSISRNSNRKAIKSSF